MHNPTKIIYEGDPEAGSLYVAEAHTILNKATAVAQKAGVDLFAKTAHLGDGVVVYALYTKQQSVIMIDAPRTTYPKKTTVKTVRRPDFYSGLVRGGTIEAVAITPQADTGGWDFGERPTSATRLDLKAYKPTLLWRAQVNEAVDREAALRKAGKSTSTTPLIHLHEGYQPSSRLAVEPPEWTDVFPRPTQRNVPSQYYKIAPSCYSGHMKKLVQYVLGLGRLDEVELPPNDELADEVKAKGFTCRYDFRWTTTHGLVKAADKRWWLVEVSQGHGVLAMPLPLYENIPEFEDDPGAGQQELVDVIAAFGGQPTGETFPTGKTLREAIARGDILQLLTPGDMEEFYVYSPYSTCLGWAFSSDGHEAHNTAHGIEDFSDGRSIGVGVHYRIVFKIGATNTERNGNDPIATASATLTRMSKGYLCRPGRKTGAQFHVPEPLLEDGSVITYDWIPRTNYTRCDTTMGVFFIGKDLQLIKFYYNPSTLPAHTDGTAPSGCGMYSGSYTWTDYSAGGGVAPQFYTNQHDYREKTAPSMSFHTYSATPGAFSGPLVLDWLDKPQYATIKRVRVVKTRTADIYEGGVQQGTHIACPYGAREAYVIYSYRNVTSSWSQKTAGNEIFDDPNEGITFRYFFGYPKPRPDDCYSDKDRRIKYTEYHPYPCSHIADAGQWLSGCQTVDQGGGAGGGPSYVIATQPKTIYQADSFLVANTEFRNYNLKVTTGDQGRWETKSPDDFGFVKHFNCVFSAFGAQHAVFNQRISTAPDDYVAIGPLHTETDKGFFSYLGVL